MRLRTQRREEISEIPVESRHPTTIDDQVVTGNVIGQFGGQEQGGISDVSGPARPAQRNERQHLLGFISGNAIGAVEQLFRRAGDGRPG